MLKKVKSKLRKRATRKRMKGYALELLGGIAVAVLTDILTEIAREKVGKKVAKKLR